MDITDALDSGQIAYHLDSRAKYRVSVSDSPALTVQYVSGETSSDTLTMAVALEPCPLLLVTISGRVIVLALGKTGTIAVEGIDSANEAQADVLKLIGKAAWETLRASLGDYYEPPLTGRKRPKPEPIAETVIVDDSEPTADTPDESHVDNSEPTE